MKNQGTRQRRRWLAWAVLAMMMPGLGCTRGCNQFPKVTESDAGLAAWARQVVPVLYGRKPRGREEVKLIVDLANAAGRSGALDALMAQQEFVDHWAEVFVDRLPIDRDGDTSQAGCYGPPQAGAPTDAIAQHIIGNPMTTAFSANFNMSDVLRSSIAADTLAPFFRAQIYAHSSQVPNGMSLAERREKLGHTFTEMFVGRQMLCLQCHNSDQSTTDSSSNWNRHWPIPVSLEVALFGVPSGIDPKDAYALFRQDQLGGGTAPWGLSGCGTFKTNALNPIANTTPYYGGPLPAAATVRDLEAKFFAGYQGIKADGLTRLHPPALQQACDECEQCDGTAQPVDPATSVNANFVKGVLQNSSQSEKGCAFCHKGAGNPAFDKADWWEDLVDVFSPSYNGFRVKPGDPANSVLIAKLSGDTANGQMPPGGPYLNATDIDKFEAWITSLEPQGQNCPSCIDLGCYTAKRNVAGDEAFAYMVAARAVDVIWEEVMGYPVNIATYFPRNKAQRGVLWHLTERVFLPNDWSLKRTLRYILTSNFFARRVPAHPNVTEPYDLPMVYDAFVEADPRKPPVTDANYDPTQNASAHKNAMSDAVYRYRAFTLRHSVAKTLDWPAQDRFPTSDPLASAIGQYLSPGEPGFQSTTFSALLEWEKAHAVCAKPDGVTTDWIDRAIAAVRAHDQQNPALPMILRDVLELERDWFLSHGGFTSAPTPSANLTALSEAEALLGLLGSPLTTPTTDLTDAELQDKLRKYCGVLVKSPQYMLHGMTYDDLGPTPKVRVCNTSPCTYQEMCNELADDVPQQNINCGTDTITAAKKNANVKGRAQRLCPTGICGFSPQKFEPRCARGAKGCFEQAPLCDPRCDGLGCCARPPEVEEDGVFVAFADGATVQQASEVRVRRKGGKRFTALAPNDTLQEGDVLQLSPKASLSVAVGNKKLLARPNETERTEYLVVSGPKATARLKDAPAPKWRLSDRMIEDLTSRTFRKYGELGPPRKLPRRYGLTDAEKEEQARLRALEGW